MIHDAKRDLHHLAYRDDNGHIQEATLDDGSWRLSDHPHSLVLPPHREIPQAWRLL